MASYDRGDMTRGTRWLRWCRSGLAIALAGVLWLASGSSEAQANRFGPPWQAAVTAEQTVAYSQPDTSSAPVGPLGKGAIIPILGEVTAADGSVWHSTTSGYVPASDLTEHDDYWIAEVVAPSASVHAIPNAGSAVRRTVSRGDLLRVTGVSPGLEGDPHTWWSTTEGYLWLDQIKPASGQWAEGWTMPDPAEAASGWWGSIRSISNVRAGATTEASIVGQLNPGQRVKVLGEEQGQGVGDSPIWYRIDGGRYAGARVHSSLVERLPDPPPNTARPPEGSSGPWIVVDRANNTLTFVNADGQPSLVTYVSLGKAGVETPVGGYSTFGKYRVDDMTSTSVSGAEHAYDLPNVPFTQYYRQGGYAIHGTYWHDNFGSVQSQGCINLTWTDAAYLFPRTVPEVARGDLARWTDAERATPLVIQQ